MRNAMALLILATALTGCGGGLASNSPNPNPAPAPQPWNIAGPWQFALRSDTSPGTYRVLNVDLSQTGTMIYTVTQSAAMVQIINSVVEFMDDCTNTNGLGDSLSGTLGTPFTQNQSEFSDFTFTFSESAPGVSEQIAVTTQIAEPNGFIVVSGTYTMTGSCAQSDSGTVVGTAVSGSPTSGASGDLLGYCAGTISGVSEFSLSAGGIGAGPEFTVYQNPYPSPPSFSLTCTIIGGQFFTTQTNASVAEINGLFLAEDTLNWQAIFGSTLYPVPGHSAYYLQEETSPASNGVYLCTAEAPAGVPNCQ